MADYTQIIEEINTNLPNNNSQAIRAANVRKTLIDMIDAVGDTDNHIESLLNAKANKVSGAIIGNFAGLDENGNLTDSGEKASNFATAEALSDFSSYVENTKQNILTFDTVPSSGSVNPVTSNGIYVALQDKQNILTFDNVPTVNSSNPVKSGGVYTDLQNKANKSEMSVVPGTGIDADKTTIQLKTGTTATVLTQHQDISGKEDKTSVVTLTGTSVTKELVDNTIYQGSELSSLTITIPTEITPVYISQINFTSGSTPTTLTAPNTIVWFGDDITNDVFVPVANKQYVAMFYYDGMNVRSIIQSY